MCPGVRFIYIYYKLTGCRDVEASYKYYLAFENSVCQDYVTEKFFRTMKYNLIPGTTILTSLHVYIIFILLPIVAKWFGDCVFL